MDSIHLSAIQMVSSTQPEQNIQNAKELIQQAVQAGANWVVLPEYWAIMGMHDTDKLAYAEDFNNGMLQQYMSSWAKEFGITLFGGTIPLKSPEKNKVFNSLLVYNPLGECISRYNKIHLFGYTGLGEKFQESNTIMAGDQIPTLNIDGFNIAQGVCYDLRFPELFRHQNQADILILPSAFTATTGKAHWEVLLRARAIENQCYVVASAQGGRHENGRETFGHSMIIDPWGEVLECLPTGAGLVHTTASKQHINAIRNKIPALQHRLIFS